MSDHEPLTTDSAVQWQVEVDDSALFLWSSYAFPSVLGGVVVLGLALLAWLVIEALLDGDIARAVVLVALAALAVLVRPFVPLLFTTSVADGFRERYTWRGLAVGSVLGALVLAESSQLHPAAPIAVFVAS